MVLWAWTPWHHASLCSQVELELSLRTGMSVAVGRYARLDPSRVRLDDLTLSDPETGQLVLKSRVAWWSDDGETIAIRLSQPELNMVKLSEIEKLIQDRLLRQPHLVKRSVHLTAYDLTLHGSVDRPSSQIEGMLVSRTLRQVRGWVQPGPQHVDVVLECYLADSLAKPEPLRLTLRRDRSETRIDSVWEFDSGPNPVPLKLLAGHFPSLNRLGSKAEFEGTFRLGRHSDDTFSDSSPGLGSWFIDAIAGEIENVDLGRLSTGSSNWLTGEGTVRFDRCHLEPGCKLDIAGSIVTRNGRVSRDFLKALSEHLAFKVAPTDVPESQYDLMAIAFQLSDASLRLRGICRTEPGYESVLAGVAITSGWNPLAVADDQIVPTVSALRVMDSNRDLLVPASSIAAQLLWAIPKGSAAEQWMNDSSRPPLQVGSPGTTNAIRGMDTAAPYGETRESAPEVRIGRLQSPSQGSPLSQPR